MSTFYVHRPSRVAGRSVDLESRSNRHTKIVPISSGMIIVTPFSDMCGQRFDDLEKWTAHLTTHNHMQFIANYLEHGVGLDTCQSCTKLFLPGLFSLHLNAAYRLEASEGDVDEDADFLDDDVDDDVEDNEDDEDDDEEMVDVMKCDGHEADIDFEAGDESGDDDFGTEQEGKRNELVAELNLLLKEDQER